MAKIEWLKFSVESTEELLSLFEGMEAMFPLLQEWVETCQLAGEPWSQVDQVMVVRHFEKDGGLFEPIRVVADKGFFLYRTVSGRSIEIEKDHNPELNPAFGLEGFGYTVSIRCPKPSKYFLVPLMASLADAMQEE